MKHQYAVTIPVTLYADDEESLKAAKAYLRRHFFDLQAGVNADGKKWRVEVTAPVLKATGKPEN